MIKTSSSSNEDAVTPGDLKQLLMGDTSRMRHLAGVPQDRLLALAARIGDLSVSRGAVFRVLNDLQARRIRQTDAGDWASFIKRGYVRGHAGRLKTLDIPYEREFDDEIAEAVLRLEQIGDFVEGTLSDTEIQNLLSILNREKGANF